MIKHSKSRNHLPTQIEATLFPHLAWLSDLIAKRNVDTGMHSCQGKVVHTAYATVPVGTEHSETLIKVDEEDLFSILGLDGVP